MASAEKEVRTVRTVRTAGRNEAFLYLHTFTLLTSIDRGKFETSTI